MDFLKAKEIRPGDLMYIRVDYGVYSIPYRRGEGFWTECERNIRMPANKIFTILEYIEWLPSRTEKWFQLKILYDSNIWYVPMTSNDIHHLCWEWWPNKWEDFFKEVAEKKKRKNDQTR